jgi:hypothetical protein
MTDERLVEICWQLHVSGAWPGSYDSLLDRLKEEIEALVGRSVFEEEDFAALAVSAILDQRSQEAVWN